MVMVTVQVKTPLTKKELTTRLKRSTDSRWMPHAKKASIRLKEKEHAIQSAGKDLVAPQLGTRRTEQGRDLARVPVRLHKKHQVVTLVVRCFH